MSNAIDSMEALHFSPIVLSSVFVEFYKSAGLKNNAVLLSNIVLPLSLYPASREFLNNANKRSSLKTLVSERRRIFGLPDRIKRYRDITANAIQYCIDCDVISINEELSVEVTNQASFHFTGRPDILRAASRLGTIVSPFEIPTIFRILGVKRL